MSLSSQTVEVIDPNSNMLSCSRDSEKFWVLELIKYFLENRNQAVQVIQQYL